MRYEDLGWRYAPAVHRWTIAICFLILLGSILIDLDQLGLFVWVESSKKVEHFS